MQETLVQFLGQKGLLALCCWASTSETQHDQRRVKNSEARLHPIQCNSPLQTGLGKRDVAKGENINVTEDISAEDRAGRETLHVKGAIGGKRRQRHGDKREEPCEGGAGGRPYSGSYT